VNAMQEAKTHQVATNVFKQEHKVNRSTRAAKLGVKGAKFRGCTIWFTGLSGAGKTTISFALEEYLVSRGIPAYGLDGDNIRTGLNKNLGFSPGDREENIRRVAEVGRLFADSGVVALCSFVSPFKKDRDLARDLHLKNDLPFFEVYVNTPLDECEKRDVKGLYKKARAGIIKGFTGIDQVYEEPDNPELSLKTVNRSIKETVQELIQLLEDQGIIPRAINERVDELFVGNDKVLLAKAEAEKLGSVEISELDLQWLAVLKF